MDILDISSFFIFGVEAGATNAKNAFCASLKAMRKRHFFVNPRASDGLILFCFTD